MIALIAAKAANGVIGSNGKLPWHLSTDLKRFKSLTVGHSVIMGRKTWESIGKPLPDRQNIVVTSSNLQSFGIEVAHSLIDAIDIVNLPAPIFVIGGAKIYQQALPLATMIYLTEIMNSVEGDVVFPQLNPNEWIELQRDEYNEAEITYHFVTYERRDFNLKR